MRRSAQSAKSLSWRAVLPIMQVWQENMSLRALRGFLWRWMWRVSSDTADQSWRRARWSLWSASRERLRTPLRRSGNPRSSDTRCLALSMWWAVRLRVRRTMSCTHGRGRRSRWRLRRLTVPSLWRSICWLWSSAECGEKSTIWHTCHFWATCGACRIRSSCFWIIKIRSSDLQTAISAQRTYSLSAGGSTMRFPWKGLWN